MGKESLARAEGGYAGLGESPSHDHAPVDHLHAAAGARRSSNLGSLGIDLIRLKISNVASAWGPCLKALEAELSRPKLRLRPATVKIVAEMALKEFIVDFCPTCGGAGEVPNNPLGDNREGAQPMKACPECLGDGHRRYTKGERIALIHNLKNMDEAFDACHYLLTDAVHEAMRTVRYLMR